MACAPSARDLPLHANAHLLAQSGRGMVLDPAGPVTDRRLVHLSRAAQGPHRCLHRKIQQRCRAIRMDQIQGLPTPCQRAPSQRLMIPGTSCFTVITFLVGRPLFGGAFLTSKKITSPKLSSAVLYRPMKKRSKSITESVGPLRPA